MYVDLFPYLSVGLAAAAVLAAVVQTVRDVVTRTGRSHRQRRRKDSSRRSGSAHAGATRSSAAGTKHTAPPQGGNSYDPRPQDDQARRRIAYHLIFVLAFLVGSLLAMVSFDVVSVDDVGNFGFLVTPIVSLVTAATSSFYALRRSGK